MHILHKCNAIHYFISNSMSFFPYSCRRKTIWLLVLWQKFYPIPKCKHTGKLSKNSKMKKHMLSIHEGNKAFECETCDKSFSKKANMKEHIPSIHEGIKSFKIVRWRNICYQFMKEIRHSNVKHVTKVICGLKLTPHFTLFDPANMIPTLGNRGLPNSAML